MLKPRVLLLPGWQDSGPGHWQTLWQTMYGDVRVEQHDWQRPLRGDWMARLEEIIRASEGPVLLVAHSLGCHLVSAWAAATVHADRVLGALLVAPPDLQLPPLQVTLASWLPPVAQRLPFRSVVVASSNDPYGAAASAALLASAWGSDLVGIGAAGHINAESGLGDWPQGRALLNSLYPM